MKVFIYDKRTSKKIAVIDKVVKVERHGEWTIIITDCHGINHVYYSYEVKTQIYTI